MLTIHDVLETNQMIQKNNLDVRTITMGISLLDCCSSDGKVLCRNIYDKITSYGENLVKTGEDIAREYGVPIINKRVAVTPISLVAGASDLTNYVEIARTLDKAAKEIGIDFIGGFPRWWNGALRTATAVSSIPSPKAWPAPIWYAAPLPSARRKPASIWMPSPKWAGYSRIWPNGRKIRMP